MTAKTDPETIAPIHLGPQLRAIREVVGVTQTDLAAAAGIGQSAIAHAENRAEHGTSLETLRRYAVGLNRGIRVDIAPSGAVRLLLA
jgi:transcriptional regulator with XRE-family HTH domain